MGRSGRRPGRGRRGSVGRHDVTQSAFPRSSFVRSFGLIALILLTACSQPTPPNATASPSATPAPVASLCKLPVWWAIDQDIHSGFVSVPDGAFTDAGILPLLPETYGGTYLSSSKSWLRASRELVSPDGTQIVYWRAAPSFSEGHVFNVASGADRIVYSGTTLFFPIAFKSDAIYLVHAINPRQGAFEKLYRLDPAGGTPKLVPGSDRHMYQYGWVLIADGAAWGIDNLVQGNDYRYSVLRLDLSTSQISSWVEGQNKMFWPQGVDIQHRLYAAPYNGPLWRIDSPGHMVELPSPEPMDFGNAIGGPLGFASDSMGAWFSGHGAVWLYPDGRDPKKIAVAANGQVWPAGPCS